MKYYLLIAILFFATYQVYPQKKHRNKVRRKYRDTEQVNVKLAPVFIHGRVQNLERERIAGATIRVRGTNICTNTNENGEYYLSGLTTGISSIQISFAGYTTKIIDYYLQEGSNDVYFTLDRDRITIEPNTITAQGRDQQLTDIPAGIHVWSGDQLKNLNLRNLQDLSAWVPGLIVRTPASSSPELVFRGLTDNASGIGIHPDVAVFLDQTPVSRSAANVTELYDLERIEILKGPQGTLFNQGALTGAVHYITKKPEPRTGGYISAGAGENAMKEVQGAINIPLWKDKLLLRTSGIYTFRDGYVKNLSGGTLSGKNTYGGRISLRFLPTYNTRIALVINYQRDNEPGTAFVNSNFPVPLEETSIFNYKASLEQGRNLKNQRNLSSAVLDARLYINENNYFSSITSQLFNSVNAMQDGDGTSAPAINLTSKENIKQFSQEVRYNFSLKSRMDGLLGISYREETSKINSLFDLNEQFLAYLIYNPQNLISQDGKAYPLLSLPDLPEYGQLAGMSLPDIHKESTETSAYINSYSFYLDGTWRITSRIGFTAGIRGLLTKTSLNYQASMTNGAPSTLGKATGNSPNLYFVPTSETVATVRNFGISYRSKIQYDLSAGSGMFLGYSKGFKPSGIQFNTKGKRLDVNPEIINSIEGGFKTDIRQRVWWDVTAYRMYCINFQAPVRDNDPVSGYDKFIIQEGGKVTTQGIETNFRAAVLKNLGLFAGYSFNLARFKKTRSYGLVQEYAGNTPKSAPVHSWIAGIRAGMAISRNVMITLVPTYSRKSAFWWDDANSAGMEQSAYGILNGSAGLKFNAPDLVVSINGNNLLNERYFAGTGNADINFGQPVFIPGIPRMFDARITWNF